MDTIEIWRDEQRIAWSALWIVDELEGHRLVAVPRLRLSHEAGLELSARLPYSKVFLGARILAPGWKDRGNHGFVVVHATFDLYRTGEADLSGFAAMVITPSTVRPPVDKVIRRTAEMLRGE